jgi:chromatin assembly factor 1 subunit A
LKQMRLPFALLTSPGSESSPKSAEKSSPKTPVTSRKRKPSSEGDNARSNKIGRKGSKENIATEKEVVEIKDSDEEVQPDDVPSEAIKTANETTPTAEAVLHIKLPSCSKSKRKINMEVKPPKPVEEENEDDSVVYLDEEDLPKKSKKSVKKSEKKKKKEGSGSDGSKAKKVLEMVEPIQEAAADETAEDGEAMEVDEKQEVVDLDDSAEEKPEDEPKSVADQEDSKKASLPSDQHLPETPAPAENPPTSQFNTIPSNGSSPNAEDPEAIHDEIVEVLSDNSDNSEKNSESPVGDTNKTPSSSKVDITKLTPKQLARRQEQEARRLEKELQRQKERDLKEQQRLKEKKDREDAKRREKEEKDEAKKREKEERDKKRQVREVRWGKASRFVVIFNFRLSWIRRRRKNG